MAEKFKILWECSESCDVFDTYPQAFHCCPGNTPVQIFICEICDTEFGEKERALACCNKNAGAKKQISEAFAGFHEKRAVISAGQKAVAPEPKPIPKPVTTSRFDTKPFTEENTLCGYEPPLSQDKIPPSVDAKRVVRSPDPNCPKCRTAQRFGDVAYCSCMV